MKTSNHISIEEFKALQNKSGRKGHNQDLEYQVCKAVAQHIRAKYPDAIFHFDYAGLHLTKAQAGKMKAIQGERGFPDLAIYAVKTRLVDNHLYLYSALFIELKVEGTQLFETSNSGFAAKSTHIAEQSEMLNALRGCGYMAEFACGTDEAIKIIDEYMNMK